MRLAEAVVDTVKALSAGGGGALVFEVEYHPHKKIHVIRVVFQD